VRNLGGHQSGWAASDDGDLGRRGAWHRSTISALDKASRDCNRHHNPPVLSSNDPRALRGRRSRNTTLLPKDARISVAFSSDGTRVLSAGDRAAKLWDVREWRKSLMTRTPSRWLSRALAQERISDAASSDPGPAHATLLESIIRAILGAAPRALKAPRTAVLGRRIVLGRCNFARYQQGDTNQNIPHA
jgi:WD40 repeat protein